MAGLELDPWEAFVLTNSLRRREDGRWAAFEVGLVVARQNGKGAILEARELAGLFLLDERLILHSAHETKTANEGFIRIRSLIDNSPKLRRRVKAIRLANGEQGIELTNGARLRFVARTRSSGRGFSADCVILDEAMELPEVAHGALLPTLSARPNPQVWYTGSAVDQEVHDHGVVLARIRERGLRRDDPGLAYFEWSAASAEDPNGPAQANPGLGIRITAEHIARERRSMDSQTFSVERLSIGNWPRTDGQSSFVIDPEVWASRSNPGTTAEGPVAFGVDVSPDRSQSSICSATGLPDGRVLVSMVSTGRGTKWVPPRLAELSARWNPLALVLDPRSPAGALIPDIEALDLEIVRTGTQDVAQACGAFLQAVNEGGLAHLGEPEMGAAIAGAATRPLGDAFAWSRTSSTADITPLVASTLAMWGFATKSAEAQDVASNVW